VRNDRSKIVTFGDLSDRFNSYVIFSEEGGRHAIRGGKDPTQFKLEFTQERLAQEADVTYVVTFRSPLWLKQRRSFRFSTERATNGKIQWKEVPLSDKIQVPLPSGHYDLLSVTDSQMIP
jgi:hypothetical protein